MEPVIPLQFREDRHLLYFIEGYLTEAIKNKRKTIQKDSIEHILAVLRHHINQYGVSPNS